MMKRYVLSTGFLWFFFPLLVGADGPATPGTTPSTAEGFPESDYFVSESIPLKPGTDGFSGSLELLQDKRLKGLKDPGTWENNGPGFDADSADNDHPAYLRLKDAQGKVPQTLGLLAYFEIQAVWVSLAKGDLYGTGRATYFVLEDTNNGRGPGFTATLPVEIVKGKMEPLTFVDAGEKKYGTLVLWENRTAAWKTNPSPKGKGVDLLQVDGHFSVSENLAVEKYERYSYDGTKWVRHTRTEKRQDGSPELEDFPDIPKFYGE